MRILYVQPFSGASGDMFLGVLLDLGAPLEALLEGLSGLGLSGWRIEVRAERRGPFRATRAVVHTEGSDGLGGRTHRHLGDILRVLEGSALPGPVTDSASRVFVRLAEAEARVHGVDREEVHFHEVGALDSIVDIVGSCLGLHLLEVGEVVSAPPVLGTGFVETSHGRLPLPAPATLELLRGVPVEHRDSGFELTTPTGAALLSTLAARFGTMPPLTVRAVGYGAGSDRPGPVPNVLRAILGEAAGSARETPRPPGEADFPRAETVLLLETNVDDMTPQLLGHLLERLFEEGALDVSIAPVLMKKSRPGHEIRVLAALDAEARLAELLFRETTTLGVRRGIVERYVLEREVRTVETPWGPVRAKSGRFGRDVVTWTPEYEDAREAARRAGVPLKEVYRYVSGLAAPAPGTPRPGGLSSEAPPGASSAGSSGGR